MASGWIVPISVPSPGYCRSHCFDRSLIATSPALTNEQFLRASQVASHPASEPMPLVELSSLKPHQRVTSLPVYSFHYALLPVSCSLLASQLPHTPEDRPIRNNIRRDINVHWRIFQLNTTLETNTLACRHTFIRWWTFLISWTTTAWTPLSLSTRAGRFSASDTRGRAQAAAWEQPEGAEPRQHKWWKAHYDMCEVMESQKMSGVCVREAASHIRSPVWNPLLGYNVCEGKVNSCQYTRHIPWHEWTKVVCFRLDNKRSSISFIVCMYLFFKGFNLSQYNTDSYHHFQRLET